MTDRAGLPLAVDVSAANPHDSQALKPTLMAVPRIARKGIDSSDRLGRHRWIVERTIS